MCIRMGMHGEMKSVTKYHLKKYDNLTTGLGVEKQAYCTFLLTHT